MLFDLDKIDVTIIENELTKAKGIKLSVIRLDKIHPVVSGNKLFKLYYFLILAIKAKIPAPSYRIITFGGAYSNHLAATAYACRILKIEAIGIVRGEKPAKLSHTLQQCIDEGMQLKFISREEYDKKESDAFIENLKSEFGDHILVPEGGYESLGADGASLINGVLKEKYSHVCCAIGTATTVAGLLKNKEQQVIGVPVLKGMTDIQERILHLTNDKERLNRLIILNDYHFGGYAKYTPELINFMNDIYQQYQIPLDFVYTAKLLYAIFDAIKKDLFPKGSMIACLHTGGLQGNLSLPPDTLFF
ncbi:1-aminocyclopropane-1-carboxylate deaminase/D-cysteine desulfhydrase [Ferruginibacter albus]|uniref:1-aminocyclopropane-1-carboxylate deaminase/D-cysteine desulfhydrase n=1 Tax=Ferruginibacter albus TaxID=2875540 RepID=UPI001CC5371A|nr:pyridoxal-phosphate dependent enzyme [Ferruginibacter albus]UAY53555.1 1-aminocyclopropane-1-carboxylate deaminase [Ferruginibacter albus]